MGAIDNLSYAEWLAMKGVEPRGYEPPIRWARHELLPTLGIQGGEGQANLDQLGAILEVSPRTVLRMEQKPLTPLYRYAVAGLLLELGGILDGNHLAWTWLEETAPAPLSSEGNVPDGI